MPARTANALLGLCALIGLLGIGNSCLRAGPLELDLDSLRPGVAAQYRSHADGSSTLARIEARPAFYLGFSSPHPRLPTGTFEVTWTGVLLLKDPAPIRLH